MVLFHLSKKQQVEPFDEDHPAAFDNYRLKAPETIVIYQGTRAGSTSRQIAFIDTATGLPTTPNGGDVTVS